MQFNRHIAPLVLALTFVRCGGGQQPDNPIEGACLRNDACPEGELCLLGTCKPGDGSLPLDVSEINASQWFVYEDGTCSFDTDCGPWGCFEGFCTAPKDSNRPPPAHSAFLYFDGSCVFGTDCGEWICADGWCTQPGYESPSSVRAPDETPPAAVSCLSDNQCAEGADCVFPGQCVSEAAGEQMTFVDVQVLGGYVNEDGVCVGDEHCGPHVCDDGLCVAPELVGIDLPVRSEFFFFDGSCSEDEHCGSWLCSQEGWCQHPL